MQLSDFGILKQQLKLDSGVPLVVFERPGMPISLRVAFFSGSRFDPIGKEGLAHFSEHMIMSGCRKYPTKQAIGALIEDIGAGFNATTSADKMDILFDYAEVSDTSRVVDLLSQLLSESLFNSQTIESERGAIRAELAGKISDPGVYAHRLWKEVAYQGSLISRDTIGTDQTIQAITREDLLKYYQSMLGKSRAVIIASGGITAQHLAAELNKHSFFSPENISFQPPKETTNRETPILRRIYPGSEQCHITIGFPTVDVQHSDYWPLYVLSRLIGGMRTSRLYTRLRNELGLIYSSSAGIDGWYGANRICIRTNCKSTNAQQVIDEVITLLHQLSLETISNQELDHCKQYVAKIQKLRLQTSSDWVNYHLTRLLHYPDADYSVASDLEQISRISLEDVNRVAKTYLQANTWYAAVCGNETADNLTIKF